MVSVDGKFVKGACSIGVNPTFDGNIRAVEVFLLDFADQIYGRQIVVWFVQRLREVQKFSDVAELIGAISRDVLRTREILALMDVKMLKPVVEMRANEIEV
jgi:riboflavin kinase/FMN adenylyltransferase